MKKLIFILALFISLPLFSQTFHTAVIHRDEDWSVTGVIFIHPDRITEGSVTQHEGAIDHDNLLNTHNLTTDIDHDQLTNTHNLTTDIDHDQLTNFVEDEHIDWTNTSEDLLTTGNITADTIHAQVLRIGDSSYYITQLYVSGDNDEYLNITISWNNGDNENTWILPTPPGYEEEVYSATYYISPTGSDATGDGSYSNPWFTLNEVWNVVGAGDTVYCRGGTYNWTSIQDLTGTNGTSADTIKIWNYPGEQPVFKKSGTFGSANHIAFLDFDGDYFWFKGLEIKDFTQENGYIWWGFKADGSNHNIFEQLKIHDCGSGMRIGINGGTNCDHNLVLNCDFYRNEDPLTLNDYDNADGLEIKYNTDVTDTNWVFGCRFWENSDDGIDFFHCNAMVVIDSCWSFHNGFPKDSWDIGGNGVGFKIGDGDGGDPTDTIRRIQNCIATSNRGPGFGEEEIDSRAELYNNSAHLNGTINAVASAKGFDFWGSTLEHPIKNNMAWANKSEASIGDETNSSDNSWDDCSMSDGDFVSVDTLQLLYPRQADGSLPVITYLFPINGSDLIDEGTDVGLPYNGAAPDIGAHETDYGITWYVALFLFSIFFNSDNRKRLIKK